MGWLLKWLFKNNIHANYLAGCLTTHVTYVIYQRYINFDKVNFEMNPVITWSPVECKCGISNLFFDYGPEDERSAFFTLKTSIWNTYDYVMYKYVEDQVNEHIDFLLKVIEDTEVFVEENEHELTSMIKGTKNKESTTCTFSAEEYELVLSSAAPGKDFCIGLGSFSEDLYPLPEELLSVIGVYFSGVIHNYLNPEHTYRPTFKLTEKTCYSLDKELFLGESMTWEDYQSKEDVIQVSRHGKLMSDSLLCISKTIVSCSMNVVHITYNSMSKNCFSSTYGRFKSGLVYSKEFEANGGQTESLYGLGIYDFKKIRLMSVKEANNLFVGADMTMSNHLYGNDLS